MTEYSIDDIYILSTEIEEIETELKARKAQLNELLNKEFGLKLESKLQIKPEPFGIAHTVDGLYKISGTVTKKVYWDTDKLMKVYESLKNPDQYINVKMEVPESRFKYWDEDFKKRFYDARTVKGLPMKIIITKTNKDAK